MTARPTIVTTLIGLLLVAAAAFPGAAAATIAPAVTLSQGGGTAAGSSAATGVDLRFAPSAGDAVTTFALSLPGGLLVNAGIDGGACLSATAPAPACQIATGTATLGGSPAAATAYLVKAPAAGDVAGVALVAGALSATGGLSVHTTPDVGQAVSFTLPATTLSELALTFTALRLPSQCPASAASVTLTAASAQQPAAQSASAPLTVTGCSGLRYAPRIGATVTKVDSNGGARLSVTLTSAAGEAGTQSISLAVPKGLTVNRVLGPCLEGAPCVVGTASLTSPLLPTAGTATLTLGGSFTAPTITLASPAPVAFSVVGTINFATRSIVFPGIPDLGFTGVIFNFTGPTVGPAFVTGCAPTSLSAKATPWSGAAPVALTGPVTNVGCPKVATAKAPTASVRLSGTGRGRPELTLRVTRGRAAPRVRAISVSLPAGLSFARSAVTTRRTCASGKRRCTTSIVLRGGALSGATARTVTVRGRRLAITFAKATARVSARAATPLLTAGAALQRAVTKHRTRTVRVTVTITDTAGTTRTVRLSVRIS